MLKRRLLRLYYRIARWIPFLPFLLAVGCASCATPPTPLELVQQLCEAIADLPQNAPTIAEIQDAGQFSHDQARHVFVEECVTIIETTASLQPNDAGGGPPNG